MPLIENNLVIKLVIAGENKLAEGENDMEFQSVPIGDVRDGICALSRNADKIAKKSQELTSRFVDVLSESSLLVRDLKVLDTKAWPETKEDLYEFGKGDMTLILLHFAAVLNDTVDCTEVLGEWLQLKIYIFPATCSMSAERCWSTLSTGKAFANVMKVINLLRVLPVSNAVLERCFST